MRKRGTHAVDLLHRLYSSLIIEQLLTPTGSRSSPPGFLAATWEQEINRAGATLTVESLRLLSGRDASAVAAEGRRLLRWTAPHVASSARTVTVKPPPAPWTGR
jgi:hypothetical protein